ncbi:MAG: hypothetical protein SOX97_07850 [Sutterella sp.]|nr:hypothetical protein [Sutterella sp.]
MADIFDCVRSLIPGRARLRHPMLHGLDEATCGEVSAFLTALPGVTGVRINPRVGSLLLEWDENETNADALLGLIESYAGMLGTDAAEPPCTDSDGDCAVCEYAGRAAKAIDTGAVRVFGEAARLLMPAAYAHAAGRAARTLQNRSMLGLLLVSVGALYWRTTQMRTHVWAGGAFLALLGLHLIQHRRVL